MTAYRSHDFWNILTLLTRVGRRMFRHAKPRERNLLYLWTCIMLVLMGRRLARAPATARYWCGY